MSRINDYLQEIKTAIFGEDVRDAIHDAIGQCYSDISTAKTIADDSAAAATSAAERAEDASDGLQDVVDLYSLEGCSDDVTVETLPTHAAIMYNTGSYLQAEEYRAINKTKIPLGCTRIYFPEIIVEPNLSSSGWATYSTDEGYAQDAYVRGGQTRYIDVNANDIFFAVSTHDASASTIKVVYEYESLKPAEYFDSDVVVQTITMNPNTYIDYSNGNSVSSGSNNHYKSTGRIEIPIGCKLVAFPTAHPQYNSPAGWATYYKNTGYSVGSYTRGGQTHYIDVGDDDRYFAFTCYDPNGTPPSTIDVYFYFGAGADRFKADYPMYSKNLAFVGDSVVYGRDDDYVEFRQLANPWPKLVGEILKAPSYNEGISGSTLAPSGVSGITDWVSTYSSLSNAYDIIGVMVGVNDCYRRVPIGTFSDTGTSTLYGSLHTFWKGMVAKYPPKSGKKLFYIVYPSVYSDYPDTWALYLAPFMEVAEYYSIPILDLRKCSGISPYSDPNHEYWRGNQESASYYSPHLTQDGANVIAPIIAKFIKNSL